ncbi:MAG: chromate transporter [Elusimicrobiota bacterium]|jgi:chromate transporter|nr:chromate transporter [Elusimicrobiota bacterium]
MILLALYLDFFKIGLFALGGGLATIPFIYELGYSAGFFNASEIANMIAVAQSMPGPIGINMASYAGFKVAGFWGAVSAALGVITAPMITIAIIAKALQKFIHNKYAAVAFGGAIACVCALISAAVFDMLKTALLRPEITQTLEGLVDAIAMKNIIFFIVIFFAIRKFKWHPFIYICLAACGGCFVKF